MNYPTKLPHGFYTERSFSQRVCYGAQRTANKCDPTNSQLTYSARRSEIGDGESVKLAFFQVRSPLIFFHCSMRSQDLLIRAYASKHKPTAASLCPTGPSPSPSFITWRTFGATIVFHRFNLIYIVFPRVFQGI